LLAGDERAIDAVERVEIAVARRMDDELAVFAVDLRIDDRVLGDFVEVVRIVRGILETPLDLAVIGAEQQFSLWLWLRFGCDKSNRWTVERD
jgi:hypothetical protein